MSNEMKVFDFNSNDVRVVEEEHGIQFVVKDVTDSLGYPTPAAALRHVPDKHHGVRKVYTMRGESELLVDMSVVDEPGLYWLVMRSNKPKAKQFIEWVTSDVLPSIRMTGGYSKSEDPSETNTPTTPTTPNTPNLPNILDRLDRIEATMSSILYRASGE